MLAKKKTLAAKKSAKTVKAKGKVKTKAKKKVTAIPKGYTSITPYLIMDNASKAIEYYQKVFGAKVVFRMDQPGGKVGHAELKIGDSKFMLADECKEMPSQPGSAIGILLYIKNVDSVIEKAVSHGAKLLRPAQDMFYGDRCGSVEDPFGHQWHISTHIEDVTPAKMKKRAAQAYKDKEMQA
ncbi:MAG: VOC family protein [Proteobacteria bacterium]|nr:VOC family protein [Pseudomonadota bacterium]